MSENVPLDVENGYKSFPKAGVFSTPSKAAGLRTTMFVMSGLTIFISPFVIMAAFIASIVSSDAPTGLPEAALTASIIAAVLGILSGIYGCVAGALARQGTTLIWTIFDWVCFVAVGINFIYLVWLGDRISGVVICLAIVLLTQLVTCICCTFLNTVKGLQRLNGRN